MSLPRTPSFRLEGKRALVTGGTRGIGLGAAVALAEAGADVTIVSRTAEDVGTTVEAMLDADLTASGRALDVIEDFVGTLFIAMLCLAVAFATIAIAAAISGD